MSRNVIEIPGKGQTTVTAGGVGLGKRASYDLTHLATLDPAGVGGKYAFLREIQISVEGNMKNTNAAARTVKGNKLADIFRRVVLNAQGHLFYDLPDAGGSSLIRIEFIETGKKWAYATDWTQAGSGTNGGVLAYKVSFNLRCYDDRQGPGKAEDRLIPVKLLQKALLEVDFCASTEFGADVSVDTATIRVTAEVVERDEYRAPALWCWAEKRLSQNDDFLSPAGAKYTDVHLSTVNSAGLTESFFANADVSTVLFRIDGQTHADTIQAADLVQLFNSQNQKSSEGYVTDPSLATHALVPVLWMQRSSGKVTKFIYAQNPPKLKVTGAVSAANYRVLEHFKLEQNLEQFLRQAQRAGVAIPKGAALMPKTDSKMNIDKNKPEKGAFLPVKVVTPNDRN